jgi:ABC-type phosphate transport system substrate-binding protein
MTSKQLLLYRNYPAEQTRSLTSFVDYALVEGQSYAPYFGYLALPPKVVELGKAALSTVH